MGTRFKPGQTDYIEQLNAFDDDVAAAKSAADAAPAAAAAAAQPYAAAAAASRSAIDNRIYPGTYSVAPLTRPDGSARQNGDEYFDSVANKRYTFNGASWIASDINTANLASLTGATLIGLHGQTLDAALTSGHPAAIRSAYVDTFHDICSIPYVPANLATYQTSTEAADTDAGEYTLTVTSGAAGSKSVVLAEGAIVAGAGTGIWPCVVKYTDGSYDFNVVRANDTVNTLTLHFALAKAAANVYPLWNAVNGQHMTRNGYRAYADLLMRQDAALWTTDRFWGPQCHSYQPPKYQQLWTKNTALTSYGSVNVNNIVSGMTVETTNANYSDTNGRLARAAVEPAGVVFGVHVTGHGGNATFDTRGKRGFIRGYFMTNQGASTTPTQVGSANINTYGTVNGVEVLLSTTLVTDFMQRIHVMIDGYDSVRVEAVAVANYAFQIMCHNLRFWLSETSDRPLIDRHANVLTIGDSWFQFYSGSGTGADYSPTSTNGAFSNRLQELMRAAGGRGTVYNRSRAGMTTAWALSWLATILAAVPVKIDVVVFNFFTNDANTTSAQATFLAPDGSTQNNQIPNKETYKVNLARLAAICASHGIEPIFLLPCGTASVSQAQNQLQWLRFVRQGIQADQIPQALSTELADATSFINTMGKFAGKPAAVGAALVYAQGANASDQWINPQNNRLSLLEPQVFNLKPYDKCTALIGTDSNSDGLSDNVSYLSYGTGTGRTVTPSISSGAQLVTSVYDSTAGSGSGAQRTAFSFSCTAGRDYLLMVDLEQCTASQVLDLLANFGGSYVSIASSALPTASPSTDSSGKAKLYWRFSAITNATPTFAVYAGTVGASRTMVTGVKRCTLIDLTQMKTDLGIDYTTMTSADLYTMAYGSVTNNGPTAIRMTDAQTGAAKLLKIVNGVVTVA
jgi:hypothetical protein